MLFEKGGSLVVTSPPEAVRDVACEEHQRQNRKVWVREGWVAAPSQYALIIFVLHPERPWFSVQKIQNFRRRKHHQTGEDDFGSENRVDSVVDCEH